MIELTPERILESKAKRFALEKHGNQRYGEHPYSYHLVRVVENVRYRMKGNPLLSMYIAVAWLHDVIEDCGVSFVELSVLFGEDIAMAVYTLSNNRGRPTDFTPEECYLLYIQDCIENAIAREVKICDTMANLTESFMSGNEKGLAKYPKQLDMLLKGIVE
jgi:(p)ppGpp synthase/HD superfamily hydrolase